MAEDVFDLYDREKKLLAEGEDILRLADPAQVHHFAERLFDRFGKLVRENEDLTRHSDRQEQRLFKLNRNLKLQTHELEQQRSQLEGLSKQLAKYLPPQIHEALFAGKYDTEITTKRKKLTVFFSDIKDFTRTAESLQPEALTEYLNEYFSEMTQIALAHGATIDKYIGDAVMLFFGDPDSKGVREDARACVEMALQMQEQMQVLAHRWKERGFEKPFVIRIGINTGYCNVGNFGSDQRLRHHHWTRGQRCAAFGIAGGSGWYFAQLRNLRACARHGGRGGTSIYSTERHCARSQSICGEESFNANC